MKKTSANKKSEKPGKQSGDSSAGSNVIASPEICNSKTVHLQFLSKSEDGVPAERGRVILPTTTMRLMRLKPGSLVALQLGPSVPTSSNSSSIPTLVALSAWPSSPLGNTPAAAIINKSWSCNFSENKSGVTPADILRIDSRASIIPIQKLFISYSNNNDNADPLSKTPISSSKITSHSKSAQASVISDAKVIEECLLHCLMGIRFSRPIRGNPTPILISLATGGSYKQDIFHIQDILANEEPQAIATDLPSVFYEVTLSTIIVLNSQNNSDINTIESKSDLANLKIDNGSKLFSNNLSSMSSDIEPGASTIHEAIMDSMRKFVGGYKSQMADLVFSILLGLGLGYSNSNKAIGSDRSDVALRGVLLSGSGGTGKTLAVAALKDGLAKMNRCFPGQAIVSVLEIKPDILLSSNIGDSEYKLQSIFATAKKLAPCVIVIDNADIVLKDRSKCSEAQKQLVSCALTLIDGVRSETNNSSIYNSNSNSNSSRVVILGCTSRPALLDPALRRAGRFDKEIELPIPSPDERREILDVILGDRVSVSRLNYEKSEVPSKISGGAYRTETIDSLAKKAHGMVGADLLQVVKEAILLSVKGEGNIRGDKNTSSSSDSISELMEQKLSISEMHSTSNSNSSSSNGDIVITSGHLSQALKSVPPSAIRDVAIEVPNVKWNDIGGMESVKQALKEVVEWPMLYPELFASIDMPPPRGVLLYGPPGCSKTLMAKALATESSMNFLAVKGPELLSKWLGESEKAVQTLFKRARQSAPSIIFFDEIDALAGKRGDSNSGVNDRVLSQLLTELDGIQGLKRVIVVAATNRPDLLDAALLRPGRIDRKIYVPPPDADSRRQIINLHLSRMPLHADVDIERLVSLTSGYSGAEVVSLSSEAAFSVIESAVAAVPEVGSANSSIDSGVKEGDDLMQLKVKMSDLVYASNRITPQITPTMLSFYEKLQKEFEF